MLLMANFVDLMYLISNAIMARQQQLPVSRLKHMVINHGLLEYLLPSHITRLLKALNMSLKEADIHKSTEKGKWMMSVERELFVDPGIISRLHSEGYIICYIGEDLVELGKYIHSPKHALTKQLRIWPCIFKIRDLTDKEKNMQMHNGGTDPSNFASQNYSVVTNTIGSFEAQACYKDVGSKLHEVHCDIQSCKCEGIEWIPNHMCEHDPNSGFCGEVTYGSYWFKFESTSSDYMLLYYFIGYSYMQDFTQSALVYVQSPNIRTGNNALFGNPHFNPEKRTRSKLEPMHVANFEAAAPTVLFSFYNSYGLSIRKAHLCTAEAKHLCPEYCHQYNCISIFPYNTGTYCDGVESDYHFNIDFTDALSMSKK